MLKESPLARQGMLFRPLSFGLSVSQPSSQAFINNDKFRLVVAPSPSFPFLQISEGGFFFFSLSYPRPFKGFLFLPFCFSPSPQDAPIVFSTSNPPSTLIYEIAVPSPQWTPSWLGYRPTSSLSILDVSPRAVHARRFLSPFSS